MRRVCLCQMQGLNLLIKLFQLPTHFSLFSLQGSVPVYGPSEVLDKSDFILSEKFVVQFLNQLFVSPRLQQRK